MVKIMENQTLLINNGWFGGVFPPTPILGLTPIWNHWSNGNQLRLQSFGVIQRGETWIAGWNLDLVPWNFLVASKNLHGLEDEAILFG